MLLPTLATLLLVSNCLAAKNAETKLQFRNYGKCLKKYEQNVGAQETIKIIQVVRGADLVLSCFTCISPEDSVEIENTYKPSSSAVGKMFRGAIDYFKARFLPETVLEFDPNEWAYGWEFARMGRRWYPVTFEHKKRSLLEKLHDRINRYLKVSEMKFRLGERFELRLKDVHQNQTGFYRCINTKKGARISNIYFVEVFTQQKLVSIQGKGNDNSIPKKEIKLKQARDEEAKLKFAIRASPWSECSYCSSEHGEQHREIRCMAEPLLKPALRLPNSSRWIVMFESVPCTSSLLPLELRKRLNKLGNNNVYIQSKKCWQDCAKAESLEREVKEMDDLGELRVMDFIPAGEFIFGEVLPRLLPPVIRRTRTVIEGDDMVLSCEQFPDEPIGVHWFTRRWGRLQHANMTSKFGDRVKFDGESRIIFKATEMDDRDEYYCYNSENVLLATHNVQVVENQRSQELIDMVKMVLRFCAFLLIFILIVSTLIEVQIR